MPGEPGRNEGGNENAQNEHQLPVDLRTVFLKIRESCHVPGDKDLFDHGSRPGKCSRPPGGLPLLSQTNKESNKILRRLLFLELLHNRTPLSSTGLNCSNDRRKRFLGPSWIYRLNIRFCIMHQKIGLMGKTNRFPLSLPLYP